MAAKQFESEVLRRLKNLQKCSSGSSSTTDWEAIIFDDLVDDVTGDGAGALVPFNEVYKLNEDGTKTLLWRVDDKGNDYTLLGTKRNPSELGTGTQTSQRQLVLNGSTWSPTVTMDSYSYTVFNVNDTNNPPTFTDSANVTSDLFVNESAEYSLNSGTAYLDVTDVVITAQAGDIIKIYYTEIISI